MSEFTLTFIDTDGGVRITVEREVSEDHKKDKEKFARSSAVMLFALISAEIKEKHGVALGDICDG